MLAVRLQDELLLSTVIMDALGKEIAELGLEARMQVNLRLLDQDGAATGKCSLDDHWQDLAYAKADIDQ